MQVRCWRAPPVLIAASAFRHRCRVLWYAVILCVLLSANSAPALGAQSAPPLEAQLTLVPVEKFTRVHFRVGDDSGVPLANGNPPKVGGGKSGRLRGQCKSLHWRDATDPHSGAFVVACPEPARRGILQRGDRVEEILREPIGAYGARW